MRRYGLILAAAVSLSCAHHPTSWHVDLLEGVATEPAGWRAVMDSARALASCDLRGEWGGRIEVYVAPFTDGWGVTVWGNSPDDHVINVVWTARAADGALPEEACHAWLAICEKNFWEAPAKDCAAAVKAALAPAASMP